MPELPEVETIAAGLRGALPFTILSAEIVQPALRQPVAADLPEKIRGQTVVTIERRGKYLLFRFSAGQTLVVHLGMTGKLLLADRDNARQVSHLCLRFGLDSGQLLLYSDVRRFGLLQWLEPGQNCAALARLGPEPLSAVFNPQYLAGQLARRQRAIKEVLLDQQVVAGLGNIYVCELLYQCRLHPLRPAASLSAADCRCLVRRLQGLLKFAIRKQGSSVSDYVNSAGQKGGFQFFFRVYDRENKSCRRCQTPVARIRQGGRSSFFCPHCQK